MSVLNNSNSVSVKSEDTHVTTVFKEDAEIVVVGSTAICDADTTVVRDMSIPDYLRRPQLLSTFDLTTVSVSNAIVYQTDIGVILNNVFYASKLKGYGYVRGTCNIRVTINCSPFQQGRLLIHFLPMVEDNGVITSMKNFDLATKTTQIGVELDFRDTTAVLQIPYITPYSFYNRNRAVGSWGSVYVTLLSPLKTGPSGENSVNVTVFAYFDDVEVSAPMVTQSMAMGGAKKRTKRIKKFVGEAEVAQTEGVITAGLATGAKVASSLSDIPVIGSYMKPLAWMLDIASGVASIFGWSKPMSVATPMIMTNQIQRYSATSAGVDVSYPLAINSDNTVMLCDEASHTDEDEMSMNFLLRVPGLIRKYTWTDTDIAGSSIAALNINPLQLLTATSVAVSAGTKTVITGPPLVSLASGFRYWRGGIEIIIKIVKTDLHSGRLMLSFTPTPDAASNLPTTITSIACLREVVDIRTQTEFTFVLPYYNQTNWSTVVDTTGSDFVNSISGILSINILNKLRSPETCSSSLELLVYARAAPDFEFAGPIYDIFTNLVTQSGIGGDPVKDATLHATSMSMGEKVTSVKQLLNRYCPIVNNNAYGTTYTSGTVRRIDPYAFGMGRCSVLSGTNFLNGSFVGDPYSNYAPLYAYYRGGMHLGLQYGGTTTANLCVGLSDSLVGGSPALSTDSGFCPGYGFFGNPLNTSSQNQATTGMLFVKSTDMTYVHCPYYCPTRMSVVNASAISSPNLPVKSTSLANPTVCVRVSAAGGTLDEGSMTIHRRCADDFQFSYFTGTVPRIGN